MPFLTDEDYLAQIDQADLLAYERGDAPQQDDAVVQNSPTTPPPSVRATAEANALAEVASYLRGRFDMDAAYALTGTARNRQLVMICVDVAIWNMVPRVAIRNVSEVRQTRYEAAIKWLTMAQNGKSNPDLPQYPVDAAEPQRHKLFQWGSNAARIQSF
jgi:phage gp36-like protein